MHSSVHLCKHPRNVFLTHDAELTHFGIMQMDPNEGVVPELSLDWRLRMALETAGLTTDQAAEMLGVSGATIRRWTNGVSRPKRAYLLQTALMTGVPARWLESGEEPEADLDELDAVGRSNNPEVTNYEAA